MTRAEVDRWPGAAVLEFGANWCGHCQAAQPPLKEAFSSFAGVRHAKVEDGPGRHLGRSYRVKLWPTLIFLKDGVEVAREVRPASAEPIRAGLQRIVS
ncbi:MAG: thioredoxin family protein [Pirellulales bacterium]|nr:thioredoxin family protein [Pirellulales bacterium]